MNYSLRGADSEKDEAFARQMAKELGIEIYVLNQPLEKGSNLQERARQVRYDFFRSMAKRERFSYIATAHHRDDNLETFLVQLLRGASLNALGGIPVRNNEVIRPLLWADRTEIDAYIAENDLTFREDQSNTSTDYLRNKVRHQLIPLMSEMEPRTNAKLESVSNRIQEHTETVDELAKSFVTAGQPTRIELHRLPATNPDFWLYRATLDFGFTQTQCQNILEATEAGKEVQSTSFRMVLQGDHLEIGPANTTPPKSLMMPSEGFFQCEDYTVEVKPVEEALFPKDNLHICIDADQLSFPLELRVWKAGETFQPLGADYRVKIKHYLKDRKLGKLQQERTVVAYSDGVAFWIPGIAIADHVKVSNETKAYLSLNFNYIRE